MAPSEKQRFLEQWEREAAVTMKVLRNYPAAQADLKPGERGAKVPSIYGPSADEPWN